MRRSFVFLVGGLVDWMANLVEWEISGIKKIWHWKDKFDDKKEVSRTTFDLNFTAERYLYDSFGIMKYLLVSTLKTTRLVL